MFEARSGSSAVFKKIIEAMKDLVTEGNLDCSGNGIAMQAMDSSHVSLIAMMLREEGFDHYRCDRNISLGINLATLSKILKCAGNDDNVTLKADDEGDCVNIMFENESQDRISDFEMKLMDIDSEHLGIPDTEYKCTVKMPSAEFQRICRDLSVLGDTCTISVSKDGIKFSVKGDTGNGSVALRQSQSVDSDKESVVIDMEEPVELTFALRYLNFFTKATGVSETVTLQMSKDVPLVCEYSMEGDSGDNTGYIRYYLAPKIDEESE